ncbi:MAG TPA: endonuclease, partial [Haploplasma sp.]|nr:endonuclease [Haploplasma sp.]
FDQLVTKPFTLKATYKVREAGDLHEYYQGRGLDNTVGDEFRANLKKRLDEGTKVKGYGGNLNSYLIDADKHPTKAGNVYTIYDGEAMSNNAAGSGGPNEWNKEHVMPQSWYTGSVGNKGDLHNLRISRASINSTRSSLKFAAGSGQWNKVSGGFYPGDDHKGDSARIAMYMMVRFPSVITPTKAFAGKDVINLMLKWHFEDPVDAFEERRNDVLYGAQNNRNPFIDHPEFAELIWGAYNANLTTIARLKTMANTTGLLIDLLATNEVVLPVREVNYNF